MTPAQAPPAPAATILKRRLFKTYLILALFIAEKAAGNLSLAWGMKRLPDSSDANPMLYLRAIFDPFVAAGVAALILALLTRMVLLSLADLSFVLPVTAVGYVIAVLLGRLVLHETVSDRRWLGTILICVGAALVSSCPRTKTDTRERPR
jgi:drug/metabolite transporter (DMT)-like permease